MNEIEKEQLQMEIQHIFDSGANEIRIFEMVKSFIESRNGINKLPIPVVVGRSEQCRKCTESTGETKLWCCNHCGRRTESF